jgi:glycine cleavage system transcriptional repressor
MPDPCKQHVVSVLVADRVGILRDICTAVSDMGADIPGISQTVVMGYFTVILTAVFDKPVASDDVRKAIERNFAKSEASVAVRPCTDQTAALPVHGDRYILTVSGRDQKGILRVVTVFLADRGINIEDWYVHPRGGETTHIGKVTVPGRLDIKHLQDELTERLAGMGLVPKVQHENIFRATNDIGAIKSLLTEGSHAR